MPSYDPKSRQKAVIAYDLAAAVTAGTTQGNDIDTQGFSHCAFYVVVGQIGAATTVDVSIKETATAGSGHATIVGAGITQIPNDGDDTVRCGQVNCLKHLRYLRPQVVVTGSNNADITVLAVLSNPETDDDLGTFDFDV